MTKEQAKEMMPIIKAYSEGKVIQYRNKGRSTWHNTTTWYDLDWDDFSFDCDMYYYRIKPEPKYRPFKTQEACWEEMHKHPDFGWIKGNVTGDYKQIVRIYNYKTDLVFNIFSISCNGQACYSPETMFSSYTFTDGTPFGIKEE